MRFIVLFSLLLFFFCKTAQGQLSALYIADRVEITWSYENCSAVDYYVIEKSKNGTTFREFLKVKNVKSYNSTFIETDNNPYNNTSFYRIRYVYNNGNYFYSESVAVKKFDFKKDLSRKLKGFNGLNLLVVIKDKSNNEFYVKLNVQENNNELISETLNEKIKSGLYTIIASENDEIVGYSLKVANRTPNSLTVDTLNIKRP
ncbi:MAG: hypothetical protein AB7O47_08210 [Flavobacteriales bacterium]